MLDTLPLRLPASRQTPLWSPTSPPHHTRPLLHNNQNRLSDPRSLVGSPLASLVAHYISLAGALKHRLAAATTHDPKSAAAAAAAAAPLLLPPPHQHRRSSPAPSPRPSSADGAAAGAAERLASPSAAAALARLRRRRARVSEGGGAGGGGGSSGGAAALGGWPIEGAREAALAAMPLDELLDAMEAVEEVGWKLDGRYGWLGVAHTASSSATWPLARRQTPAHAATTQHPARHCITQGIRLAMGRHHWLSVRRALQLDSIALSRSTLLPTRSAAVSPRSGGGAAAAAARAGGGGAAPAAAVEGQQV